jgi:hypothetical protein
MYNYNMQKVTITKKNEGKGATSAGDEQIGAVYSWAPRSAC